MKNTSQKLKFLFLFKVIILFSLSSCGGTRQTSTQTKDSVSINNTYSQGEKIVLGNTFTYTPFDAFKPMKIDNKEYVNVIITNNKDKIIEKWKNRNITKTITVEKVKQTERKNNNLLWIGIATVVIIGVVAYLKIPSFKI